METEFKTLKGDECFIVDGLLEGDDCVCRFVVMTSDVEKAIAHVAVMEIMGMAVKKGKLPPQTDVIVTVHTMPQEGVDSPVATH